MTKVSIIIPSYNHRPYVGKLIESIYAQTFKDFEVIAIDDGSKDGSPEYLNELQKRFGFNLVLKENEGLCATLNRGLALATGKYIVNIGSDDLFTSNRLSEQVSYLEQHPEVDVIGGKMFLINEEGKDCGNRIPAIIGPVTFQDMIVTNRVFAPTAMIRKSVFEKFGPYPKEFVLEDYYLWLKVLSHGGVIRNVDAFWVYYRISNTNLEKKFNWYYNGAIQALLPYQNLNGVKLRLHKQTIIFSIKLALVLGTEFRSKYFDTYKKLSTLEKVIISLIAFSPKWLRDYILIKLRLKT